MVPYESSLWLFTLLAVAEEVGPEAVKPFDGEIWHLADPLHPVTLCGETILYGARRLRFWHEAPEEDRCAVCFMGLVDPAPRTA